MAGYDWGAFYGALGIPAAQASAPTPPPTLGNPKSSPLSYMGGGQVAVDMGHDSSYWRTFYNQTLPWYGFPKLDPGSTVPVYDWNTPNPIDLAAGDAPGVSYSGGRGVGSVAGGGIGRGVASLGKRALKKIGVLVGGNWNTPVNSPVMPPASAPSQLVLTDAQKAVSSPEYIAAVASGSKSYTPAGSPVLMPTTTISGQFRQNYGDSNSNGSNSGGTGNGSLSSRG